MSFTIELPKISCVMVTEGRLPLIKKSVHCYLRQTYENRELIVLSQGSQRTNSELNSYLKSLSRNDIIFIEADPEFSLGKMRNLSIELASGEIICQWDDDDLYHPYRIAYQFSRLQGAMACCYSQHLKYFENRKELYWVDWGQEYELSHRYLPGSIMFYKTFFYKAGNKLYPEKGSNADRNEDFNVLERFLGEGPVLALTEGHHYIYVYHGQNTYSLPHHELVLNKPLMKVDQLMKNRSLLDRTFKEVGLNEDIAVRSKDEIAYHYYPDGKK